MPTASNRPTVAVVGGGMVGLVLTLGLVHRGLDVKLYERNAEFNEYGASLGVNYSAYQALKICGPATLRAVNKVIQRPKDGSSLFKVKDGYTKVNPVTIDVPYDGFSGGVHRAHFHQALADELPAGTAVFGKSIEDIVESEDPNVPLTMKFADGSEATADVVIGCDGVGSHVRRYLLGKDHPASRAQYAHRYAFRAVIPMEEAIKAVGAEVAEQSTFWKGKGGQIVTVSIANGTLLSIAAMVADPGEWCDPHHLTVHSSKAEVEEQFKDWSPKIRQLMSAIHADAGVDKWALFDTAEQPVPFYARGHIAIAGDAAHATTPHLGSGAGFGFEDAAVLCELLADEQLRGHPEQITKALAAYSEVRVPRGHWLAQTSRRTGKILESGDSYVGDDMKKLEHVLLQNAFTAWYGRCDFFITTARDSFHSKVSGKLV